ncbi:zeta toxin family protein [Mucilaginibacter flavus]|uniref:zeta toxin family protein n=1 Tax=Mucilaginibacter flavus TaxID=931504 RepID=UPI0025B2F573|nr:zeta toxin family protein [Mucilaginibacter flavus]MDN3581016.1 zeta toxin family protein [Mucilaginibacter flavus]
MASIIKPQLFIVTGSNGAGKSTLKQTLLPPEFSDLNIFDGDIFFTQKSTEFYKKYKSSKESRKLAEAALEEHFLDLTAQHIREKLHFAYEGHFTGAGAWKIPEKFKEAGFEIHLIFCGLNNLYKSVQRVDIRVKKGGFHVPPLAIENNFYGNMEMLNKNFKMFHSIEILDTSNNNILPVCSITQSGSFTPLSNAEIPNWFKTGLPEIYRLLVPLPPK